ncbi:MAG: DNA-3-methyladenine glycosylase family protein [Candidatus Rokuibacteriota bacterium]
MNITLVPDGPLDARATLARYRTWGEDPANRVEDGVFRRVLKFEGRLVPYEVRWQGAVDEPRLLLRAAGARGARAEAALVRETRAVFGLDFDLPGFYRMAKGDAVLAELTTRLHGLRPTVTPDPFEMLVHAIGAQQVNLTFAFTLRARLIRRYGTPVAVAGGLVFAFPEAGAVARARPATLRAMQYSTSKAVALRGVAAALAGGGLDAGALAAADDAAVITRLTALHGIGRWTADWFLARCLGRGAVCPAGDLAVRKAFEHHWGRGRRLEETAIRRRAAAWGPYQSLAVHYLLAGMRLARPSVGGGT